MASSLPVIASDWNGYRDLVDDGETGWLIPCRDRLKNQSKPSSYEQKYALGLEDYDSIIGLHNLGVVVEHKALEMGLKRFIISSDQCKKMGEAGREKLRVHSAGITYAGDTENYGKNLRKGVYQRIRRPRENWPMASQVVYLANMHSKQIMDHGSKRKCTDAKVLNDTLQSHFLKKIVGYDELQELIYNLEQSKER